MLNFFRELLELDGVFWIAALAGTGFFLIQLMLSFFADSDDSIDDGFSWLSKQSLTGFLMMFGWVGLTCRKEFAFGNPGSVGAGVMAGALTMVITGAIFKAAKKMKSSGTMFSIDDAVGKSAVVYQKIETGNVGRITISLHSITHEIDAISRENIESFAPVRVVEKIDEKTVRVESVRYYPAMHIDDRCASEAKPD